MIRTVRTSAVELRLGGCRLDGWYYSSVGAVAWRHIESSGIPADTLAGLCVPGGLYIPHRFKRPYVRDAKYGVPYITGSSIGLAEPLQNCSYLSRRPGAIPGKDRLMLEPGTILVTSSGDPGIAVYVNDLFSGVIGSPDLLRVVPDTAYVPVGYLCAFLSSPLGRAMLGRGTYGGVIPHIEVEHVADLPVPRLAKPVEQAIHKRVEAAATKRVEASRRLRVARERVYAVTGLPQFDAPVGRNLAGLRTFTVSQSTIGTRFEGRFHDIIVRKMVQAIKDQCHCQWQPLSQCVSSMFLPDRGKWINVSEGGLPLVGSGDMFLARPIASRHVSMVLSPGVSELIVRGNDILVARSGQIYSILGDAVLVGRSLAGKAVTEHAIRIRPDEAALHPGFLYAFLSLPDYGYGQIIRTAYGTSVPSLSVDEMNEMAVAVPDKPEGDAIGEEVLQAIELRDQANDLEDEAQAMLNDALDEATRGAWSEVARSN